MVCPTRGRGVRSVRLQPDQASCFPLLIPRRCDRCQSAITRYTLPKHATVQVRGGRGRPARTRRGRQRSRCDRRRTRFPPAGTRCHGTTCSWHILTPSRHVPRPSRRDRAAPFRSTASDSSARSPTRESSLPRRSITSVTSRRFGVMHSCIMATRAHDHDSRSGRVSEGDQFRCRPGDGSSSGSPTAAPIMRSSLRWSSAGRARAWRGATRWPV